ncbi:MAG TPA: PQQ-binding-like beta-propeller repeat protein [Thermoguttaceae bacterium]|nr:PQQ-binding-like beta-propeller repeat protein [Thermoguttaceae bacterium]
MIHLLRCRAWPMALALLVTVVLLVCRADAARADTWPRFRGPNGSGVATAENMPDTWTEKDYAWRVELPSPGFSSPVVWNDRIYVTSGDEKTGEQIILSLDAATGKTVWEKRFAADPYKKHRFNSYATSTPALDADHVYVTWGGPKGSTAAALDRQTGELKWRHEMGPFLAMHNFGASPMVVGDTLIVMNDQQNRRMLLALDRASGKVKWKSEKKLETEEESEFDLNTTYATPCVFTPPEAAVQLIVGRSRVGVMSLDPQTGRQNWRLDLFEFRSVGSPTIEGDRLVAICGSGGGGQRAAVIQPGVPERNTEPKVLHDVQKNLPYVPTPLLHDGLLYLWAETGQVKCIDLTTGKELWHGRARGKFYSSPVLTDGKLYSVSDKGKVTILSAGRDKFELLGQIDLEEPTMSTPAISDGVLYFRTLTHLMALPSGGKTE